jgi:hypothetical protein
LSSPHAFSGFTSLIYFYISSVVISALMGVFIKWGSISRRSWSLSMLWGVSFNFLKKSKSELIEIFSCFLRQPEYDILQYSLLLFYLNSFIFCLIPFLWWTMIVSSSFIYSFLPSSFLILKIMFYFSNVYSFNNYFL